MERCMHGLPTLICSPVYNLILLEHKHTGSDCALSLTHVQSVIISNYYQFKSSIDLAH